MKKYLILIIGLSFITSISFFFYIKGHDPSVSCYPFIITGLLIGMIIILGGCELFAKGVECLGNRFNLSHATAGSLLAVLGTTLPETIIPAIALLTGKAEHKEGIAVGAILGAPFMLSTLAMFLLGTTVLILRLLKKRPLPQMNVNIKALLFGLRFFIIVMGTIPKLSLKDLHFREEVTYLKPCRLW